MRVTLALCLALPACDPGATLGLDPPASCALPAVGSTCPYIVRDADQAAALLDGFGLAHCAEGEVIDGTGPAHDVIERGCQGDGYRYPAGGYIPGWGFTYQTAERALVRCDDGGRVVELWHLAECDDGRRGLVLDAAWSAAVDAGRCWITSHCADD